jgi:PEP-CTERM motif
MNMTMARSAAAAGVMAAGVVCAMLSCAPARAGSSCTLGTGDFAFACVLTDADLNLTLSDGATVEIPTDLQGTVSPRGAATFGAPSTAYLAGVYNGASYNNFFEFTLPSESPGVTVTSATLTLYSGVINSKLNYTLFGPTAVISSFTPRTPNRSLYNELGTGTVYATYILSSNTSAADQMSEIVIGLNAAAVSALNSAAAGAKFQITGHVSPAVPEPSTWIMILAGFAGLGVAGWRREARRRAAASAG